MATTTLLWMCGLAAMLTKSAGGLNVGLEALDYESEFRSNKNMEGSLSDDYLPVSNDREERFIEGLIVEAGRHVLFPELYDSQKNSGKGYPANELISEEDGNYVSKESGIKFYEIRGQPEMTEDYTNRKTKKARINCPSKCSMYKPVCGSDGKVYASECHMLKENCGSPIKEGSWSQCRGKHYLCPSHCLDLTDPVCASDGKIYNNVCIMRKKNCGKLVHVQPLNKCYENTKEWRQNDCPEKCPMIAKPACGSNGIIYYNDCFMKMKTCKEGITEEEMENCAYAAKCPKVCLPLYDPVCGSDNKFYINRCIMLQQNCGKQIRQVPSSLCASRSQGSEEGS